MNVSQIRQAIADALSTVDTTPALSVTAWVPDSITTPAAFVQPETITYDKSMCRGTDEMTFTVHVLVSRTDDRAAQLTLDALLAGAGLGSVKGVIESTRQPPAGALSGLVDDVRVTDVAAYRWFVFGDVQYLSASWTVYVMGSGT